MKNSHRLLSISWRILRRKQRILQSLMPNEDPEIIIYLFIYYLEGFLVKAIILLPCQQRFLSDIVSFMSLTSAWLAQSFKQANYSNVSDVNDFTNAKNHAENISLLAGYPTAPILMENLALYNLDLPDAFRVPLKATVWYSSVYIAPILYDTYIYKQHCMIFPCIIDLVLLVGTCIKVNKTHCIVLFVVCFLMITILFALFPLQLCLSLSITMLFPFLPAMVKVSNVLFHCLN